MHYYPPALDYVMYVFGSAGVVGWVCLRSQPLGRGKGLLKLASCLLVGSALLCGGFGGVLFNLHAPVYDATGSLTNVIRTTGKNQHREFYLRTSSGLIGRFSAGDNPQLKEGARVDLSYQAGSLRVLHLKVLEGLARGFIYEQADGSLGAYATLALACLVLAYGVLNFLSDGTGGPESSQEDTTPAPDGAVDTNSMLKL